MSEYFDPERVEKIKEIMPRFTKHCRVGDRIQFGLEGDTHYPEAFRTNRPAGVVTKIKNVNTPLATLRVRTDSGQVVDVPHSTVNPERLWDFEEKTFAKVLARTQPARAAGAEPTFRASAARNDGLDDLRAKVDQLNQRLDAELSSSRSFNGALIASFNELAGEVHKQGGDTTPFASSFTKEYRSMIQDPVRSPAVFDSDFSDSDDGM